MLTLLQYTYTTNGKLKFHVGVVVDNNCWLEVAHLGTVVSVNWKVVSSPLNSSYEGNLKLDCRVRKYLLHQI